MKRNIKAFLKRLPVAGHALSAVASWKRHRAMQGYDKAISARLAQKREKCEPIHVVFVCHRPAVWESLRSVYDAMKQDLAFRVTLVAIPNKKLLPGLGLSHEQYESEGAEEFWKEEGCIHGYDYTTGQWMDLEALEPDYVFFQQPYNSCRPPQYHSGVVSRYARLCYVPYFGILYTDDVYDECVPLDFLRDLYFFFTQNRQEDDHIRQRVRLANAPLCHAINTGFPRYDRIEDYRTVKGKLWQKPDTFKMVWTPRWTTNEGNCHFFDFKDLIVAYCKNDPAVELVFRPHPQAFKEWNATGELPEAEASIYKQNFVGGNMHLDDSSNYFPTLYSSDCLITDKSAILLDYFCTGKPIIYCLSENNLHDRLFPEYMQGMYCVEKWEQVQQVLDQLRSGNDPLASVRESLVRQNFVAQDMTSAEKIVRILRQNT